MVPAKWSMASKSLNPMLGIIEAFRWTLIGDASSNAWSVWVAMSCAQPWRVLLGTGVRFSAAPEETLTDVF